MAAAGVVAVTGASGFIGARLTARLRSAGYRVRALRHRSALAGGGADGEAAVESVRGGLDDEAALRRLCEGAQAVVHCAALVKARRRADFDRVNAEGVARLARAAAEASAGRRVLLLSSLAAREPRLSPYAASKRAGERRLAEHGAGLAWIILRPPAVYGPGDRELLRVFRSIARGFALRPAPPAARFSLIHVDDLAAAVLAWLAAPAGEGATYEVDDGRPGGYAWDEAIDALAAALGVRVRTLAPPAPVLYTLAAVAAGGSRLAGRAPMLTPGKLRELRHLDWVCRDGRLAESLGWRPEIGLEEGVRQTVAWYRGQGWL